MSQDRRTFLSASAAAAAAAFMGANPSAASVGSVAAVRRGPATVETPGGSTYTPWLEVDAGALRANAAEVARLGGGRPVVAVVKNNGYGLGLERVGRVLDRAPEVAGLAVVTVDAAHALRDAGVAGPILHMGLATAAESTELARRDVRLAPFDDRAPVLLREVARELGRPVLVHLYLDTGMGRLGMPVHRARAWLEAITAGGHARIEGTFCALVEDDDFDREQLARLRGFADHARSRGLPLGRLHAASTHALFFRAEETLLDAVRPGLALYGAYPGGPDAGARERAALRPAFALRARVVRVERLRPGDGVSYGHNYIARSPTWIATLPVGHADGYPRRAVDGAEVLIGGQTYPVIGAVSASHTIVELGEGREPPVAVGDAATLVGDHPSVHLNTVAEHADASVYDILMHLGARLPGVVIGD